MAMIKLCKAFFLAVMFLLGVSADSYAQVKCANKQLADLVELLPDIRLDEGFAGEVMVPAVSHTKPVLVLRNAEGVIHHIGIKFFDREIINRHPSPVYHFIERYFLELLLMPHPEDIKTKMKLEHVQITSEVFSLENMKKGLQDIVSAVSHDLSVYITSNNQQCSASCLNQGKLLAKINFPLRYELITGFSKLEAENSVYTDLLMAGKQVYKPLGSEYMSTYKDGMYSANNEEYYVTEDIISTTYYNKVGEEYVPVFSPDLLKESVYNLFNTGYDWGVEASIEQNLYGNKKNTFDISLAQLANFFKSKNCSLYTGVRKYDKSKIEGVMMAVNMELGYQHIMMFTFNKSLFDKPAGQQIKIKMYSYVPIHNVSSLL